MLHVNVHLHVHVHVHVHVHDALLLEMTKVLPKFEASHGTPPSASHPTLIRHVALPDPAPSAPATFTCNIGAAGESAPLPYSPIP